MRAEYEIVYRLMLDSGFRSEFLRDRHQALLSFYPNYKDGGLFGAAATTAGLEEEAFRRRAGLYRTSKEIFPRSHSLLLAFIGQEFFDSVLSSVFARAKKANAIVEILEPFDGYLVGPMMLSSMTDHSTRAQMWIGEIMRYEWAVWHARRVAQGWPALTPSPQPLPNGTTLLSLDFDLKKTINEIKRLQAAAVSDDVYRWRLDPVRGSYRGIVFPKDGDVFEARLEDEAFEALQLAMQGDTEISSGMKNVVSRIGLVLETSFLCCPREDVSGRDTATLLSDFIQPQPH